MCSNSWNSSSNPKTSIQRKKNSISNSTNSDSIYFKLMVRMIILHVRFSSRKKKASPSPCGVASTSPAATPQQSRRASLLHPDHARLQLHHLHHNHHNSGIKSPPTPDRTSIDEEPPLPPSPSSSTTSSLRSMPSSANAQMHSQDRRRSSR